MLTLEAGLVIFIGVHLFPAFVSVRQLLIYRMGETGYRAIFSLVSLGGFGLIVYGMGNADMVPLWEPPVWGRYVTVGLMPLSILLLAAANMPSNIKRITPHPMLWGTLIWSVAHLFSNGDQASLLLFGGFIVFSVVSIISANRRGARRQTDKKPFAKDVTVFIAGLVGYSALIALHPYLFGVAVR